MSAVPYARAATIGVVAGMRAMTAPAATLQSGGSVWAGIGMLLAAGEYIADKLPMAPSRLAPPGLIVRFVSGGICGGVLAARAGGSRAGGIVIGAAAAGAAAWALASARRYVTKTRGVPDLPIALLEDALAIIAARAAAGD